MLNERKITVKVMDSVKVRYPDSLITKHADRSTRGVPDFSVCTRGITLWIEMKYLRESDTLKEKCDIDQLIHCHQRYVATEGKCLYVIFNWRGEVTIWTPEALFRYLKPALAGPVPGTKRLGCNPFVVSEPQFNTANPGVLKGIWEERGAIEVASALTGPPYHVVSRIIAEFVCA